MPKMQIKVSSHTHRKESVEQETIEITAAFPPLHVPGRTGPCQPVPHRSSLECKVIHLHVGKHVVMDFALR
jgi:hypothetical protein